MSDDCKECGHAVYQHLGPGQACNVLLTPGERCRCNHFREKSGDCLGIDSDPESLCTLVKLAAQRCAGGLDRTEKNLQVWRMLLSELLLNDSVDERARLTLLFEYCETVGPDLDMFKSSRDPRWNLED